MISKSRIALTHRLSPHIVNQKIELRKVAFVNTERFLRTLLVYTQDFNSEVRDQEGFGSEPIGHAEVNLDFFKRPNGIFNEAIELWFRGQPAGRIVI